MSSASASIDRVPSPLGSSRQRVLGRSIPAEGENGLFSQSWFPLCLSSEVGPGQVIGTDFLDGRVIVFRSASGKAQVLSAYCPHLGADLSVGDVYGDTIRCAFHHWQYDQDGVCVKTGVGDPPPPGACLFKFSTAEKHGLIWAFNGDQPLFEIPDFPYPEEELVRKVEVIDPILPVDPWVICCNTPDMQHHKALHGMTFDHQDPDEEIEWTEHSMLYDRKGRYANGELMEDRVGNYGTTIFYQSSVFNGRWFSALVPLGLPRPGQTKGFLVLVARKSDGDATSTEAFLNFIMELLKHIVSEDIPIMQTIHFRPGTLTKSDKALGKFLQYVRNFPRAHPSAEFIS
ncbi:MAG TPA: Rieske 2Fe-2S domain-containing protein [Candidatus Binatia bacterium]|nr:Rieske 2Fe-2S domain-containing protein [Candidatus Binatia bacterium]